MNGSRRLGRLGLNRLGNGRPLRYSGSFIFSLLDRLHHVARLGYPGPVDLLLRLVIRLGRPGTVSATTVEVLANPLCFIFF
jgi:hypothetical protein